MDAPKLETRKCVCGCGMEFKTLPDSKQIYSCIFCEDRALRAKGYYLVRENRKNKAVKLERNVRMTKQAKREQSTRLKHMIAGGSNTYNTDVPRNQEELKKLVGF